MRLREQTRTWAWAETVLASGETDASLRRKLQRDQVSLTTTEGGRTDATLYDIGALRLSRHLCDHGFEATRAFGLARFAIKQIFADEPEAPKLVYLVAHRSLGFSEGGVRWLPVDPAKPADVRKLILSLSDSQIVIVPIHWLLRDAWYNLPDLPHDVAEWLL